MYFINFSFSVYRFPGNIDCLKKKKHSIKLEFFSKYRCNFHIDPIKGRRLKSLLKVKCNEIWTIFLLLKIFFKNISHINRKQNKLSKLGFAQTVVLKIRKSDGFRELDENEPELAEPRLETNIRYLWRHVWLV